MSFEFSYFGPELPVVGLLFALMLLVSEIGYRIGRSGTVRAAGMGTHVTPLVTGTLALVALLLGFSLSMAVSRFDVRGQLVQAEATAIGTAHLRARLLPAPEGPALEDRLRRYVDLSLETAGRAAPGRSRTTETVRAVEALQTEMLVTAVTLARQAAHPAPADRFAEAMKDVIDVHERRLSAFESFVPETVLHLLGLAALGGALLAGYGCGLHGQRNRLATSVHTVLVCVVILVIVDLDRPQHGMIRVSQRSLERLPGSSPRRRLPGRRPIRSQPRARCGTGVTTAATSGPPSGRIRPWC
jgi:hypothetical protein